MPIRGTALFSKYKYKIINNYMWTDSDWRVGINSPQSPNTCTNAVQVDDVDDGDSKTHTPSPPRV